MIDYTNCNIEKAVIHFVGNKINNEELIFSKSLLDISDLKVRELLFKFFLPPFTTPEFFNFSYTNEDFTINPIYNFVAEVFESPRTFHRNSINFGKHLYELSNHPQIKSGDLFVVYFSDIRLDNKTVDALGIFKSENRQPFLKVVGDKEEFSIHYEDGINIEKLDKGCIIFNTAKKSGYIVSVVDKSNKSVEAQYWKDTFLFLRPCSDNYHHTKEFLNITKNYITKQLDEEFEITKADQIDLLNKSVEYFKTHEEFVRKDFEKEVFQDDGIIKSFRNFNDLCKETSEIEMSDNFEISERAVKKQAKVFKSVLKLDKNFHIYIHGDKSLIEQGVEKDGRKFYKIYFDKEL